MNRKRKKNIPIVLLFLIGFSSLWAQKDQIRFEHITTEDGLSEGVVNCIFQDSKGFMWFGTYDGLNRYDGYSFKTFKSSMDDETTINSNLIFAITEDFNGNIWIGTTGSGLNCFNPSTETFTHYLHDPENPESISSDHVSFLKTDQKGRIWVSTNLGLDLLIPGASANEAPKILRIKNVMNSQFVFGGLVAEDKGGNIWIGTTSGLFRCIEREPNLKFEFQRISFDDQDQSENVTLITVDEQGRLVVGSLRGGLFHQTQYGNDITFTQVSDIKHQQCVILDNQERVWTGSYAGLHAFKSTDRNKPLQFNATYTTDISVPNSLNNNLIRSLYKDNTGIIWIGTNGGGINKFDPERKQFYYYGDKLKSNGNQYKEIRSILEDSNGDIWIGTDGGGLFRQSAVEKIGDYEHFSHVEGSSKSVFALAEVNEGNQKFIYVGSETSPTLQKINITNHTPSTIANVPDVYGSVFSILQDINNILWVGTYNHGLSRLIIKPEGGYEKTVFRSNDYGTKWLSSNIIRKIFEDSKGNIWVGTADGLNRIQADQTTLAQPTFEVSRYIKGNPSSLSHNYILDIHESSSGQLWIGTFGGGLNKLVDSDPQFPKFKRYQEKNGLSNNTIKSIEEDIEGNLWIGSNRGIAKFDPEKETFQNYTINDGLQSSEFGELASIKRASGEMVFGGVNGFNAFFPGNIIEDSEAPVVSFTKLLVNNTEVHPNEEINGRKILSKAISNTDELTLQYRQNDFSIEFTALHFAAPQYNKYAFKLKGYHDDWVNVDQDKRYATFTNLPQGSYKLLVKASNGDNVWTTNPKELKIIIEPPFWLAWYAFLFYATLIGLALWGFRRYTLISINEKHQLNLDRLQREKLEELNQMKLRFFTNISHELRTPLTLIIAPLEVILEKGKNISAESLQQQYHYMYKNAKYLLRLVNQLLDFRKLDQGTFNLRISRGDIKRFIVEITEPFQFLANKKNIEFNIKEKETSLYTHFDPDVIEKVMYNLLSNAFKFTPAGGKISIQIIEKIPANPSKYIPSIEIRVQDNGPGISRKKVKKIFERFYKEGAKKENKDGVGIGLAFTKSLVKLHHGSLKVNSDPGEGACFIVKIPMENKAYLKSELDNTSLQQFEPTSDPLEYLVTEPVSEIVHPPVPMNMEEKEEELPLLLFVDDNSDIRRFIRDGLQNDFRIIEAEDGEKGYEIAIASLPDIIISDVMMPNMSGTELCQTLKTNPLTSHIPIVLLTAKSAEEDELAGLETGADAYVIKPFKLDILLAQLRNIHHRRERLKQRFRQEVILQPEDVTVTSADEDFLKQAMTIIEEHMSDSEFNVEALVKEMFISRSKLYLKLKALTGQSSSEFIRTIRLKRAIQLLEKSDYTIKEIMFMTGFNTASYFSKCFKKQFGVVPSEYLKKQA